MVFFKATTLSAPSSDAFQCHPPVTTIGSEDLNQLDSNTLSEALRKAKRGTYSHYVAKTLMSFAGWSYSDFDTFKDKIADSVGPDVDTIRVQVKNEAMLVQATAQMIRTKDKKVAIVVFRGTELTNLVNWVTNAMVKQSDFYKLKKNAQGPDNSENYVKVHTGFKSNFEEVWFGNKGILMHLLHPERIRKDYDYDKPLDEQRDSSGNPIPDEQKDLEAIYVCGHSLGGAMAFLAGLYLGAFFNGSEDDTYNLFSKLRGVYTYGSPMVVDDWDRSYCERICGDITFRHVYYNDIVPHLPPLSIGAYDHVGPEYRYHPRHGWRERKEDGFGWHAGRSTQVGSILAAAPFGAIDGVLDQINWLNFFRGESKDWPVIGVFSLGYLKMPWSFLDHNPVGYIASLAKLEEQGVSTGNEMVVLETSSVTTS